MSITYFLTDPTVSWTYETFYTPSILPFFTVGLITCFIHIKDMDLSFVYVSFLVIFLLAHQRCMQSMHLYSICGSHGPLVQ